MKAAPRSHGQFALWRYFRPSLEAVLFAVCILSQGCKGEDEKYVEAGACGCDSYFRGASPIRAALVYRGNLLEVNAEDVHGLAIFEGDVILGSSAKMRTLVNVIDKEGGFNIVNRRFKENRSLMHGWRGIDVKDILHVEPWPGKTVPYVFDGIGKGLQAEIEEALKDWESSTEMKFVEGNGSEPRFIRFKSASSVGKCSWGGGIASVTAECARHEIGHALGLFHEHTRPDRDNWIKVIRENIKKTRCSQFAKNNVSGAQCGQYDFKSIMHYPATAFTCNGGVTLKPKRSYDRIEHDDRVISSGDFEAVNAIHGVGHCS